jgi:hypothetical protein
MKTLHMHGSFYDLEDEPTRVTTKLLLGIVGIWFIAALVGGMTGLFSHPNEPPLYVGLFILAPILGFTLAYRASTQVRHALDAVPLRLITLAHVVRFVGIGFVIGVSANVLPAQFGYPAGWGDAIAAFLCLPLAWAIGQKQYSPRMHTLFVAWNIFGMIDLVTAVTLGILYSPSSFGLLRTGISTGLLTTFPVNLIPTFFVPCLILLHVLALARSRELAK